MITTISDLLDYLDGRGIIFVDEDLVTEALKECKLTYEGLIEITVLDKK
jgi:hypothetical protein